MTAIILVIMLLLHIMHVTCAINKHFHLNPPRIQFTKIAYNIIFHVQNIANVSFWLAKCQ